MSGRQDSNLRPPGPKPGAMTGLRYAPKFFIYKRTNSFPLAVRAGFEPAVQLPVRQFSKLFLSASQAPHLALPFLKRCANVETKLASTKLFYLFIYGGMGPVYNIHGFPAPKHFLYTVIIKSLIFSFKSIV